MTDKPFREIWDEIRARSSGREIGATVDEFMQALADEMDRRYPPRDEARK